MRGHLRNKKRFLFYFVPNAEELRGPQVWNIVKENWYFNGQYRFTFFLGSLSSGQSENGMVLPDFFSQESLLCLGSACTFYYSAELSLMNNFILFRFFYLFFKNVCIYRNSYVYLCLEVTENYYYPF